MVVTVSASRHVIVGGELAELLSCSINHRAHDVDRRFGDDGRRGGCDVHDLGADIENLGHIDGTGSSTGTEGPGKNGQRCKQRPASQSEDSGGETVFKTGVAGVHDRL